MKTGRVLLVSMPLSSPHYPSLALGLLKPAVTALGLACDVRYFSLDYFEWIGEDAHACLTDPAYYMAHVGEWAFSGVAHDTGDAAALSFLTECFADEFKPYNAAHRLAMFLQARASAAAFIEQCFAAIDWPAYGVVGFSTSYQQTMASLALARRIKSAHPHIVIVFGGVNCQDAMGHELLSCYDWLDAVCVGEGDHCFAEMLRRWRAGLEWDDIAGLATRGARAVPGEAVTHMDRLPYPDYDDFFSQHAASPTAAGYTPAVVFETARGCWWGERHTCTFCGLNGTYVAFRAKSDARAFDELVHLVARYDCRFVANADKILDERYFAGFLPRLADAGLNLTLYYEVKVGLTAAQLGLLARAGVRRIQFGIETFDSGLLRLMAKGTTMLQNIEVLKLSAEAGIYVEWLALSGFPGERAEQYDRLADLLPALFHLQPPSAFIRARADRFSPWQREPERYGVELAPLPAYRHIFPFDPPTIARLANHFIVRSPHLASHDIYVTGAAQQYSAWQEKFHQSGLWMEEDRPGHWIVHDSRGGAAEQVGLSAAAAALLGQCWRITRWRDIVDALADRYPESELLQTAATLQARRLLLNEGSRWLALVLRQPEASRHSPLSRPLRRAPTWAEIRERQSPADVCAL
jgi:ribosomal peptide maturation radical SAM protein 1